MGTKPSTTNGAVSAVDQIIHTVIMDVATAAAKASAVAALPWLNLPIVSTLFNWIVDKVFSYLSQYLEDAAAFAVIDAQTNSEAKDYQDAVAALKSAQKTGDPHELNQATQNFKDTLSRLIHYDGS